MAHTNNRLARDLSLRSQEASPGSQTRTAAPSPGRSEALFFGHPDRPLFGWLHLPHSDSAEPARPRSPLGLLICNPFGNEAICAHRSLRHIAERACRNGLPVLRFDYEGTGDSAGEDRDPHRVAAWLDSLTRAADELRYRTGVDRLCFLGIRLGATLAATVAAQRDDVESLIAIAPVVSGKSYVREMRLLQRAMEAKRDASPESSQDVLEAAGFVLSAATQAALGKLDLKQLEKPPAPEVLVIERAEMPGDGGWTRHLQAQGATVTRKTVPGYAEMMLDSHESVVPEEMLTTTFDWLLQRQPSQPVPTVGTLLTPPHVPRTGATHHRPELLPQNPPDAREAIVHFGEDGELFGIVTWAPDTSPGGHDKAIVLVNSGAVHRIGPNRLYVTLARHFCRQGYLVLRMDITGLGDSPPRQGSDENVVYSKHAVQDIAAALDYLRREHDITRVHAMGLCSGAYHAFKGAVAGLPLTAVTLINPLTFFWKDGMSLKYAEHRVAGDIVRYRTNAFRVGSWLKLLRGKVSVWELSQVLARRMRTLLLIPIRAVARLLGTPLKDDLPAELRAIVRHGIQLHFVFSATDPGHDLLTTLGGRTVSQLSHRGALKIQTIDGADHTFTAAAARAALIGALDRTLHDPERD